MVFTGKLIPVTVTIERGELECHEDSLGSVSTITPVTVASLDTSDNDHIDNSTNNSHRIGRNNSITTEHRLR